MSVDLCAVTSPVDSLQSRHNGEIVKAKDAISRAGMIGSIRMRMFSLMAIISCYSACFSDASESLHNSGEHPGAIFLFQKRLQEGQHG